MQEYKDKFTHMMGLALQLNAFTQGPSALFSTASHAPQDKAHPVSV
jgi:hypothetical protein